MNILLVDDQQAVHEEIEQLFKDYPKNDLNIFHAYSGKELLESKDDYQAVFLDIDMQPMDGIKAGMALRAQGNQSKIIMLTGKSDRIKDAFKIGATRFVSKPIEKAEIFEALDYIYASAVGMKEMFFQYKGLQIRMRQRDIYAIIAQGEYVEVEYSSGVITEYKSLHSLLEELDPRLFVQIHKSYIVNMYNIQDYTKKGVILKNGKIVPIARRKYKEFINRYLKFEMSVI